MTDITMPRLADGMEQGTIISWLVADGQPLEVGDELCDIETDKATMTYQAEVSGVLTIVVAAGETVAVDTVIARAAVAGEATSTHEPAPADDHPAADHPTPAPAPAMPEPVLASAAANGAATTGGTVVATPIARRVAAQHDVVLERLTGTGPSGRIVKSDVLRAAGIAPAPAPVPAAQAPPAPTPTTDPERAGTATGDTQIVQPSRLQQIVAQRMAEAKSSVPHFQVQTDVVMDDALALRARLKEAAAGDAVPSVNDIIVRASALALREHPLVNASYRDGAFELHSRVNVGIAVASDAGLVVVTIRDADIKSLGQIAREAQELAGRVRAGTVTPTDLAGATFTVSNLGMFGMTAITPVINPPQAAIVGVGAARPTLARTPDGDIIDRHLLTLTLSCDHRILNGADGSRFLADVKARLEAPLRLAL